MNTNKTFVVLFCLINFGNLELTEVCQSWNDKFVDPDCHYNPDAGKDVVRLSLIYCLKVVYYLLYYRMSLLKD